MERDGALPAGRPAEELRASLDRFTTEARAMPAPAWDRQVPAPAGWWHPAWYLLLRCLRELETHHLDLDTGHGSDKWPDGYVRWALDVTLTTLRTQGFPVASVRAVDLDRHWSVAAHGPSAAGAGHRLLGWLSGTLPADALTSDRPAHLLPRLLGRHSSRWAAGWSLGLRVRSGRHSVDRCGRYDAEHPASRPLTASDHAHAAHGEGRGVGPSRRRRVLLGVPGRPTHSNA